MKCLNCNKDNIIVFFNEVVPCAHCHEDNDISYNVCEDCGLVWKSIDGQALSGVIFSEPELGGMLGDSFEKFMNFVEEAEPIGTMDEVIHKCLRCNTISFEVEPRLYHCPECGFEWEVI
jgi:hypothetical protein